MTPTPCTNPLLRVTCAACAGLTTALIGLFVHSLARNYDVASGAQATAPHQVVAQAQPR
jgi:hypothetical protein